MNPLQMLPFMINHFISTKEGKERHDKFKEKFPEMHNLIKQHQAMHKEILKQMKTPSKSSNTQGNL